MSISIKYLFPGILAVAFFFTSLVLVAGLIYFFYIDTANFLVKDKAALLQVVQRSIYDPQFYYRTFGAFPALKRIVILEAAKSPDVVFLRIVEPSSGKIAISGNEEENGKIAANTPFFFSQPSVRDGKWQGKSIKEISIEGVAGEALWMGVDFGSIQKMALVMAIQAALLIISAMIISYILLFFILRKFFMAPFSGIVGAIRRFGAGESSAGMSPKPAALKEINELETAFVKMAKDVIGSRFALEQEKNKIMAIINNFADGILVFDSGNNLFLINPAAESFFGVGGRSLISKPLAELAAFSGLKPLAELLMKESGDGLNRKELPIGNDLFLEISAIPAKIGEEKLGTLVIAHDITREKRVESMKTEFVTIAAHQLRTPLSAIKWTLKMFLDGDLGRLTKEQKSFMVKTHESNERMIGLINDLLNVTKIEEGRYLYKPVSSELEPIAQFVVSSYKEEVASRGIKLTLEAPEKKLPQVVIDVEKIRLVFQNLIDNAVRYTPKGGAITIIFEASPKEIECRIKDTGVGIPSNQQDRVFTKFFRGANVMRLETEGSGLGLFIAKNIIEAHGGKMRFESKEGEGTTFFFTLPIII